MQRCRSSGGEGRGVCWMVLTAVRGPGGKEARGGEIEDGRYLRMATAVMRYQERRGGWLPKVQSRIGRGWKLKARYCGICRRLGSEGFLVGSMH